MNQSQLSKRKKAYLISVLFNTRYLNKTLNSGYKLIYRYKNYFFVFDIIEFEY